MRRTAKLLTVLPICLLLAHCGQGDDDAGGALDAGGPDVRLDAAVAADAAPGAASARIETRLAAASGPSGATPKFRGGAASASGLASLKYQITSIQVCKTLETRGSAFHNPGGCLELYHYRDADFDYDLDGDFRPLVELARSRERGFIDLLSPSSRSQLASSTPITEQHVGDYHFGVITWALPIKLTATVAMSDGSSLYTHDGTARFETIGADGFRAYFTESSLPLDRGPAEEAVVLLPNGGNWFKFQSPLTISAEDIAAQRAFWLDLVFNPDGVVKGFTESHAQGALRQRSATGGHLHDITVPMLDLAPIPHRATEQVMRESYRGAVALGDASFDLRLELYYVAGDPNGTVYGVDVKSLVNAQTRAVPPELSKVSFLDRAADGSLTLSAHEHTPIITGLRRVVGESGSTRVALVCATHADREAAEGKAAIVVDRCPSPTIDVNLSLTSRSAVSDGVPTAIGTGTDAGADASAAMAPSGLDAAL